LETVNSTPAHEVESNVRYRRPDCRDGTQKLE
jgi:uncharacterized protein YjaZ